MRHEPKFKAMLIEFNQYVEAAETLRGSRATIHAYYRACCRITNKKERSVVAGFALDVVYRSSNPESLVSNDILESLQEWGDCA